MWEMSTVGIVLALSAEDAHVFGVVCCGLMVMVLVVVRWVCCRGVLAQRRTDGKEWHVAPTGDTGNRCWLGAENDVPHHSSHLLTHVSRWWSCSVGVVVVSWCSVETHT